jgi:DNA-binding response OmpR family regulator
MLLPVNRPVAKPSGARKSAPRRAGGGPSPLPRLCALIVDPDRQTRDGLRQILDSINVAVVEAETADQARTCLAANTVHIALVEVNLPGQAGDLLAGDLQNAGIAPVLMSATPYGLARARRTKFQILPKPFTVKQALRAIVLVLPTH